MPVRRAPALAALAVAALAVVAALAGCSRGGGPPGRTPATTPPAVTGLGARAGDPEDAPTSSAADRGVRTVTALIFQTPSKNIVCDINAESVRCDIVRRTWTPPPAPAGCEFDYGGGAVLARGGEAELSCISDTLVGAATATLAYGDTVRAGALACTSDTTGLTCRDTGTGRGFTLAVKAYRIF